MATDYAKRLDELDAKQASSNGIDDMEIDELLAIARALLKERDQLEADLQEMIDIDHSRLSPTYGK